MPAAPEDAEVKDILKTLERDSRVTPEQIAEMTGRDVGEVARLIAEAEAAGIIRRYKSVIDWERAGDERVLAFIDVRVLPEPDHGFDDIARRIYRHPEVRSVYLVSGQNDLRVIVEGRTMQEVAFFVSSDWQPSSRCRQQRTISILKRYKEDGDIFEDQSRTAVRRWPLFWRNPMIDTRQTVDPPLCFPQRVRPLLLHLGAGEPHGRRDALLNPTFFDLVSTMEDVISLGVGEPTSPRHGTCIGGDPLHRAGSHELHLERRDDGAARARRGRSGGLLRRTL